MANTSLSFSLPPHWQARIERHLSLERVLWILALILFLVAWNRGLHLLYALFSFLLSALLLSYGGAWWQLRKLSGELKMPLEAHVGREEQARLFLRGSGRRFLLTARPVGRAATGSDVKDGNENNFAASVAVFEQFNDVASQAITVNFYRRGRLRLEVLVVTSCFPFGLVRPVREIRIAPAECVVYPRIWPMRQLPVQHLLGSQVDGDIPQHQQRGEEEFAMVRAWRDGDEMRNIHWHLSAKYQDWVVREFDSTRMPAMAVILNPDPRWVMPEQFDPREHMLEIVASLAEKCASDGVALLVVLDAVSVYQVKPFQRDLQPLLYQLALWQGDSFELAGVLPKLQGNPQIIRFSCTLDGPVKPLPLMAYQQQIDIRFDHDTYTHGMPDDVRPVKRMQKGRISQLLLGKSSSLWELF